LGWDHANYWSATPTSSGHATVGLGSGQVYNTVDGNQAAGDGSLLYVALQVL
jgi:hypothetical protein